MIKKPQEELKGRPIHLIKVCFLLIGALLLLCPASGLASAPPIVMLLLDNSGSMGWDILCPGATNGYFFTDDVHYYPTVSSVKEYWESQWAGRNTIYYDPQAPDYAPWLSTSENNFVDADLDYPLKSPLITTATAELNDSFLTLGTSPQLDIPVAHYYVWSDSDGKPWLVILRGSGGSYTVEYYEVNPPASGALSTYSNSGVSGSAHVVGNMASVPADVVIEHVTAVAARQDFANWYQYARTRQLSSNAVLADVVAGTDNVVMGAMTINVNSSSGIFPAALINDTADDNADGTTNRDELVDWLYEACMPSGGTALRKPYVSLGEYFKGNSSMPTPYYAAEDGGASQTAAIILVTDGYYNGTDPSVDNADGDDNTEFDGGVFGDMYDNTMADCAMAYYEDDLRSDLEDKVPTCQFDQATHQHVVTYTLSFGLSGTLDPNDYDCLPGSNPGATYSECPEWPYIDYSKEIGEKIDDLWHAAVNGRGMFRQANNALQLGAAMRTFLQDVVDRSFIEIKNSANLINWNGNLAADFGDNGLWYNDGSSWHWMTNTGHVDKMVAWDGKLVADFGAGKGIWNYDGTWHWMTNNTDPNMMIAYDNGSEEVLVVDFGAGERIYTYDGSWNWFKNKDNVADMAVWNNKLIVDFGSGRGLYNYDGSWNWMSNKDDVNFMLPWDNGTTEKLVVDFGGGLRIWTYDGTWNWFTNKDDVNDMVVWNQKLVVDFGGGRGLYTYDGTWNWLNNKDDVARMVPWDYDSDLAVDFGAGRNMYNYDGVWTWMKNANDVPEMVDWGNRLAVDFGAGVGVYYYNGSWNLMKDWSTAD